MAKVLPFLFAGFLLLAAAAPLRAEGLCGDFLCDCEGGESQATCPQDCGICGDLICDPGEGPASCPGDCGTCGDLICSGSETPNSCPIDCPRLCGDLICEEGEEDCPQDCGDAVLACELSSSPSPSPEVSPPPDDGGDDDDGGSNGGGNNGGENPLEGAKFGGGGCSLNPKLGN